MTNAIEKAKSALAAVTAARVACEAAGMTPLHPDKIIRGETDALAAVEAHAERWVKFAERRELPISIGDTVLVSDAFGYRSDPQEWTIETVGRELVYLSMGRRKLSIRFDTGSDSAGSRSMDDADIVRVVRGLVKKREKKGRKASR